MIQEDEHNFTFAAKRRHTVSFLSTAQQIPLGPTLHMENIEILQEYS
jgi:hypothetical protein